MKNIKPHEKLVSRNDPWAFSFTVTGSTEQIYVHPLSIRLIAPIEESPRYSRIYGIDGLTWTTDQEIFSLVMDLAKARNLYKDELRRIECKR